MRDFKNQLVASSFSKMSDNVKANRCLSSGFTQRDIIGQGYSSRALFWPIKSDLFFLKFDWLDT